MITPEQKDRILIDLIEADKESVIVTADTFPFPYLEVEAILRQLVDRKFIFAKTISSRRYTVRIEAGAYDHLRRGGFKFEEEIFRHNFAKLEFELAKLESDIPQEKFSNIMTLISTAAAAVSAYASIK